MKNNSIPDARNLDINEEVKTNSSRIDTANKSIFINNESTHIEVSYGNGIMIKKWAHANMEVPDNAASDNWEAFVLEIDDIIYPTSVFEITGVQQVKDETHELTTILMEYDKLNLKAKVCFLNDMKNTVNFIIQLSVDWPGGCPREVHMNVPFLANFYVQGSSNSTYHYPANPFPKRNGQSIVNLNGAFRLPLTVFDNDGNNGFSIDFPLLTDHRESSQNRNLDLRDIYNKYALENHKLILRPGRIFTDVIDLEITAESAGWVGLFNRLRDKYRKTFDLREYEREDFSWYKDTLLHHFTYVYGKEAYDYESNKFDIDRLLDQGDEFGGYDTILIWHQYPRLGVDKRNQFDFYNDFPGGRAGIRELVDKAHKRNTKVLLPFKPWDIPQNETSDVVGKKIADLVRDTDIDGFFLDTMASLPSDFRRLVDEVKPGVVFCSEGQPGSKSVLELLTSSWDQFWNWGLMPEVVLLRFMLPEHIIPSIARWHVGDKKDRLIKRAIFNGFGLVIWQDIFGSWLPYSAEQKAEIKKWKAVWSANKSCFLCNKPIPLYPTLVKGLHCNMFPSDNGDEIIYCLYNENDEDVSGSLLLNWDAGFTNASECWYNTEARVVSTEKGAEVIGTVGAKQLAIIKAYR